MQKGPKAQPSSGPNSATVLRDIALEFTDDEIQRIEPWLPEEVDPWRRELLPRILREWAKVDLRGHFTREPAATGRERRARFRKLSKIAGHLLAELDQLSKRDLLILAAQIGVAEGQETHEAIFLERNTQQLNETRNFIAALAAGLSRSLWEPSRGQPRNIPTYFVMMDLASIFAWLTGIEPTRRVDRTTNEESGPFRDFAGAIWPLVFGSDQGFPAAMKNWAAGHKKYGEQSPLIYNIDLRHPEWGIFERF